MNVKNIDFFFLEKGYLREKLFPLCKNKSTFPLWEKIHTFIKNILYYK